MLLERGELDVGLGRVELFAALERVSLLDPRDADERRDCWPDSFELLREDELWPELLPWA